MCHTSNALYNDTCRCGASLLASVFIRHLALIFIFLLIKSLSPSLSLLYRTNY